MYDDAAAENLTSEELLRVRYEALLCAPCIRPNYFKLGDPITTGPCRNTFSRKCPPCAARFLRDLRLRVYSGMESVLGSSPTSGDFWFVTLTAPGFGSSVHNRREDGSCSSCEQQHSKTDPLIGYPKHSKNYRFWEAVQWNYLAPKLWHGYVMALRQALSEFDGSSQKAVG